MASEVQICNLGLSRFGDAANVLSIDPPDGSVQAEKCAQFYPVARDATQEAFEWAFCTRRANLVQITNPLSSWVYAYALPNKFLQAWRVLLPGEIDESNTQAYKLETSNAGAFVLYTNVENASLVYAHQETNTGRFSALYTDALSWLLASYTAGPILKGKTGVAAQESAYRMHVAMLARAAAADANQHLEPNAYAEHRPSWISDR